MLIRLRLLPPIAARAASVGLTIGLAFAAAEVAVQRYLADHLWRTALHAASYDTLLGVLAGLAAAFAMWLSLAACAARTRSAAVAIPPQFIISVTTFFAIAGAAAVLLAPFHAPRLLGVSHWVPFGTGIAVIWLFVAGAATDPAARDEPRSLSPIAWPAVVALTYLVGLAHLWVRGWPGWITAAVACAGILASLGLASVLSRPAARIAGRLHGLLRSAPVAAARWAFLAMIAAAAITWVASPLVAAAVRARSASTGTNVLLIAVDTLRYDAVSLLTKDDQQYDLTPELRRLLSPHATVYTHAYSASAWTLSSFSSMFTGLYPEQHRAEFIWSTLGPEQVTLAELLRERGYSTMAVVSGHFVTREAGVAQGFAQCDEGPALSSQFTTAETVTDRALRFLEGRGRAPFFLFVHYFEPHFPYIEHPDMAPAIKARAPAKRDLRTWGRASYDGEVEYTDHHIGRLLRFLDRNQLWKNTCVIFVADHGEEFYEHGSKLHGRTLFQEIIHVPLAIAAPGADLPRVVSEPVETRRLFSTILQVAGAPLPSSAAAGLSLLTGNAQEAAPVYSATCAYGRDNPRGPEAHSWLSSLTNDRYKLIHDRNQGEVNLFDLRADPGELTDLSRARPDVAAPLRRALTALEASVSGKEPSGNARRRLTEQEQRHLKDLGYL